MGCVNQNYIYAVYAVYAVYAQGSLLMPIGKQLHLLLNQTDILMLGIGGFVEQIMIGPMMNAMSHNLESSSTSVCGIDSFFRKLLHFVKGHLFVGKFNLFDSFT